MKELSLLAFIATCAKGDIGFSDFQTSVLVSLVFLGEFFGSLSFGMIADKFGRLKSFLFGTFSSSLPLLTSL
jgi:MFS family permease